MATLTETMSAAVTSPPHNAALNQLATGIAPAFLKSQIQRVALPVAFAGSRIREIQKEYHDRRYKSRS
jgi:hypothetical protein